MIEKETYQAQNKVFLNHPYEEVKFQLDDTLYSFDTGHMMWRMDQIAIIEVTKDDPKQEFVFKPKSKVLVKSKREEYEMNKRGLAVLHGALKELEDTVKENKDKLKETQAEQEKIILEFQAERAGTERVKNARERLEKLKKELGI